MVKHSKSRIDDVLPAACDVADKYFRRDKVKDNPDRNGNGADVFSGAKVKKCEYPHKGYEKGEDEAVYEAKRENIGLSRHEDDEYRSLRNKTQKSDVEHKRERELFRKAKNVGKGIDEQELTELKHSVEYLLKRKGVQNAQAIAGWLGRRSAKAGKWTKKPTQEGLDEGKEIGGRVKIHHPGSEFHGSNGTVIDHERDGGTKMYRVQLDKPVHIDGVGKVTDDLWSGQYLKSHRNTGNARSLLKRGRVEEETILESLGPDAHELVLFADNHAGLHHSSHEPIMRNLAKKHAKGVYDPEKAKKLWAYHADRAAMTYHKEHGEPGTQWHKMFTPAHRKEAAEHWEATNRDELHEDVFDESRIIVSRKRKDGKYDEVGMNNRVLIKGNRENSLKKQASEWAKGPHRIEWFGDNIQTEPHKTTFHEGEELTEEVKHHPSKATHATRKDMDFGDFMLPRGTKLVRYHLPSGEVSHHEVHSGPHKGTRLDIERSACKPLDESVEGAEMPETFPLRNIGMPYL